MPESGETYEFKSVQAIRGTEARSIAKWQKAGWELVDQTPGKLRTTLNFRRLRPKVPWLPLAILAGVVLVVAIVAGVVSLFQGGDDQPSATTNPASSGSQTPSKMPDHGPSSSGQQESASVLTVANNSEFAALLNVGDACDASVGRFATKYEGKMIEFNGSIADFANHGDYDTRYDILLGPGDKGPETTVGPAFKFENVNVFDLNFSGANAPDTVGVGDRLHVVAEVGEFNQKQCILFLAPVSTKVR